MVQKPNTVRICCDLPVELHEVIKDYNQRSPRQVNLAHTCLLAIEKEVQQILAESKNSGTEASDMPLE